jgi:PKD repeat protein
MPILRNRSSIQRGSIRAVIALAVIAAIGMGCRSRNSNDEPGGGIATPIASFSQDQTGGLPGLVVQFTDTSTGPISSYFWDFGNGRTSNEQSPAPVAYDVEGDYTVSLTVAGNRGDSTRTVVDSVRVADLPMAAFSCSVVIGFAPLTPTCTDESTGTGVVTWDFGDGSTSTARNPTHTYSRVGDYTITQSISNPGGSGTAMLEIDVEPLSISTSPPSGQPPAEFVLLIANTGDLVADLDFWTIDGLPTSDVAEIRTPGTYTIQYTFGGGDPPIVAQTSIEFVVAYGAPTAEFSPSVAEGTGPLSVTMNDESTGEITRWEWDFGDGSTCEFPAPSGGTPSTCDSSSPTHVYGEAGRFDVSLTVTGPGRNEGDADVTDSIDVLDAVTVTILDPSFEGQTVGAEIAAGWTTLRPAAAVEMAQHIALSDAQPAGADAGMPSDGQKWAALDGLGTDGSTPVDVVENGIRQVFYRPATATVLEFDYALLYSEPPSSGELDAVTATVSDGVNTVEITSAQADVSTPYVGSSIRYPTLDSSMTRVTPLYTASLDLAVAFPGASLDTQYTLTIRLANFTNSFRSPRAYVDNIRFTEPANDLVALFALETTPVVSGLPVVFNDETCPIVDPDMPPDDCEPPTSLRWDFDTQTLLPPPSSTGSAASTVTYVFPEAGDYDVTMLARNGDKESLATMTVSVIQGPMASFTAMVTGSTTTPMTDPATVTVVDTSTSDAPDPIVAWSWDFGGFPVPAPDMQDPGPVVVSQPGPLLIRLTITTASGLTDTGEMSVNID